MKEDAKKAEGVADEDGWVKVTRHGRNKAVARTESLQKRVLAKEKHKKKQKVCTCRHTCPVLIHILDQYLLSVW